MPPICRGEACFDPDLPSLGMYMFCSMPYYHHHTDLIFLLFVPNYHSLSDCKTLYVKRTLFLVSTQKNIVSFQNFLENAVHNRNFQDRQSCHIPTRESEIKFYVLNFYYFLSHNMAVTSATLL